MKKESFFSHQKGISRFTSVSKHMKFFFVLYLLLGLGSRSIVMISLFSLFYITGECYRFLHRG